MHVILLKARRRRDHKGIVQAHLKSAVLGLFLCLLHSSHPSRWLMLCDTPRERATGWDRPYKPHGTASYVRVEGGARLRREALGRYILRDDEQRRAVERQQLAQEKTGTEK